MSRTSAWDGWSTFYCRVETRTKRGKTQWRYVVEREFVRKTDYYHGRWSKDEAKVRADAECALQSHQKTYHPDSSYV